MERSQTLGFILIFMVLMGWLWLNSPKPDPNAGQKAAAAQADSLAADSVRQAAQAAAAEAKPAKEEEVDAHPMGRFFAGRDTGTETDFTIETDLYRAVLSTKGASIRQWELKKYKTWAGYPVQMVDRSTGDFGMLFGTSDGKTLSTSDLYFETPPAARYVRLDEKNFKFEIKFTLPASNGGTITKTYTFTNDSYGTDVRYEFDRMNDVIANYVYEVTWDHGVPYAEHNTVDESGFAASYAFAGGELTELDAKSDGTPEEKQLTGQIAWVGVRNKYFAAAMIPVQPETDAALLRGVRKTVPENGHVEKYAVSLRLPYKGSAQESSMVRLYLGPLDHGILTSYGVGLEKMMSLGWAWIIRPIAEYIFLPLFVAIHYVIPNWGIVIIIFSILIKLVLHPLTRSSMKSMKKMQALQPMIEEMKEKYKEDPGKMNQAIMSLYKEYGVNPAGGCLPLLLQMPILYALFALFRSAIELRQASFVGWIHDLSVPDVLFSLPFHLPIFGVKDVSGIALLMGVTMFVQQKMSVKDPRQKMMVWMMPIMFTLLFNSFPSGLNLYYAVFNVLSIGQQYWMNKSDDGPLRKVEPKKKNRGGVFKKMPDIKNLRRK